MGSRKAETFSLGAVDSRSNPANYPPDRSLRCINWAPQESGRLQLRLGYTAPMQATNDTVGATTIHSIIYYEQFAAAAIGPQYVMYGKGTNIFTLNFSNNTSTKIGTMPSGNPWGHYRAANRIFIATGDAIPGGMQSWDGTTLRPVGIATLTTPGTVGVAANTQGSIAPTSLAGYTLFAAWYNPNTGHMGNRATMGTAVTVGATQSCFVLTGFGAPPNSEWVTAVGRTNDGGLVPYWCVDANGNHIVLSNTSIRGTILLDSVDYLSELPINNYVPGPFDKFTSVGTRVFANLSGSPEIYYFNDYSDIQNADYVGNPFESSPPNQATPFPTGECPTALHTYRTEGWFFSRTSLAIFSTLLLNQGANPWRGPWPGGCAGQRAFVETPYGPYWVTWDKQLVTFMEDGVIPVCEEYQASELSRIANQYIPQTEVAYLRDPDSMIDQIVIRGLDTNGNPVVVIHDFFLKDERSPFGCGYRYTYSGATLFSFAGAGYTPRQNVYDTNGKMRLWAGCKEGFIAQLEDGSSDNGENYTADMVKIIGSGPNRPVLVGLEIQGDQNVIVSWAPNYSGTLGGFSTVAPTLLQGDTSRWEYPLTGESRWFYVRLQLTSHPKDGSLSTTDPPFLPLPTYGSVNEAVLKFGRERPEGR